MTAANKVSRFFRRKPGETIWPKERVFQAPVREWAPPWTCVTNAVYNARMKVGSCHRGPYAQVYSLVNSKGETRWYWSCGDVEGLARTRSRAKDECDLELLTRRIRLHESPIGYVVEEDDGPTVNYEEM